MTTTLYRNLQKLNKTLKEVKKSEECILVTFYQSAADKGIVAGNHTGKNAESNDHKNVRKMGLVDPEPIHVLSYDQAQRLGFGENAASIFKVVDEYSSSDGIELLKDEAREHLNRRQMQQSQKSRHVIRQQLQG